MFYVCVTGVLHCARLFCEEKRFEKKGEEDSLFFQYTQVSTGNRYRGPAYPYVPHRVILRTR